jgi:hypothetical protein
MSGVAVEAEQRLDFGAESCRHLVPRVVLLALRWQSVGQLAKQRGRIRVHDRLNETQEWTTGIIGEWTGSL